MKLKCGVNEWRFKSSHWHEFTCKIRKFSLFCHYDRAHSPNSGNFKVILMYIYNRLSFFWWDIIISFNTLTMPFISVYMGVNDYWQMPCWNYDFIQIDILPMGKLCDEKGILNVVNSCHSYHSMPFVFVNSAGERVASSNLFLFINTLADEMVGFSHLSPLCCRQIALLLSKLFILLKTFPIYARCESRIAIQN